MKCMNHQNVSNDHLQVNRIFQHRDAADVICTNNTDDQLFKRAFYVFWKL